MLKRTRASKVIPFFVEGQQANAWDTPVTGPYLAVDLESPRAFSSGKRRTVAEVQSILDRQRAAYEQSNAKAGESASIADAIQTVLAWDTIYDPENQARDFAGEPGMECGVGRLCAV